MISTIIVQNILFSIKDSRVGDDDFQASCARRYAKLIDSRARRRKRKKIGEESRTGRDYDPLALKMKRVPRVVPPISFHLSR